MTRLHLMASRLRGLAILAYLAYLQPALTQFLDPKVCSLDYHGSVLGRRPELSTCPLPVDEDSAIDTGNWQPWKRRPYCIDSLQFEQHPPEFCVYAFEPFRGDKGISVITTPVLAASMVDALDDSVVPPKLRNHPSSSLAREGQGSTAYVMKDIPGKGKGLVATRPIRKWDLVIVEYPAMLAHMGVFEVVGSEMRQEILERALHLLPEKQQSEIMSLARKMIDEPIEDILRTNIFGVELGIEIPHLGLFPIASRINHDCKPNVFWRFSVRSLTVEVVALRDIEAGEEITQSYIPLGLSYEERMEGLDLWAFKCKCSLCAASKSQRALSDRNREKVLDIYHELNDGATGKTNITAKQVKRLADKMESLVHEETLEAQLLVYWGVIARAYMRVDELVAAKKYVDLCEDLWIRFAGEEEDYLAGMRQLRHELKEREKKILNRESP